jgi:hypothetical protein
MKLSKQDFDRAVAEGLLEAEQAEKLWKALASWNAGRPGFEMAHVLYYFGALIVMSAMGWFMTKAWESLGGGGIMVIALVYAACFVLAGRRLWFQQNLKTPGGLLFTLAVWMTPLAIYGFQRLIGVWPQGDPGMFRGYHVWVKGSWLFLEIGTIIAGLAALKFIRFPFLTFPIAFSLWYMSMDLAPLLFGLNQYDWNWRLWTSLLFGLAMLIVSFFIDRRTKEDYAFWGYLFGMSAFWFGLSLMNSNSELNKFIYCLINLGLMFVSVLLQRRVFIIFGAMGVFGYLGHLAYRIFEDSLVFPLVLTGIGLLVIYLGVKYQRHRDSIDRFILGSLHRILPAARATQE